MEGSCAKKAEQAANDEAAPKKSGVHDREHSANSKKPKPTKQRKAKRSGKESTRKE